jgi:hypothetical protein
MKIALRECRWPDSNRHGPITAQRILSPLRLPFRHIGVGFAGVYAGYQPAKTNFARSGIFKGEVSGRHATFP